MVAKTLRETDCLNSAVSTTLEIQNNLPMSGPPKLNGRPRDPGELTSPSIPSPVPSTTTSSSLLQSGPTSAWAGGAGLAGSPRKLRSFAEIIAEQKSSRNILVINLIKQQQTDVDGNITKPRNLNFDEIGTFIFDVLKIPQSHCMRFNYVTCRYDTKEVMLKPGVDISPYLGTNEFLGHLITTTKQLNNVTKVTFKNVPLNIPDEEILNLCDVYGKPVDYMVHYEKMTNPKNRGHISGVRYVEMEMFQGASFNNFYWMEGPLAGDTGARITVLHPGQITQCSWFLRLVTKGRLIHGNRWACKAVKTYRQMMTVYMEEVRKQHGYQSLKQKYFKQFPSLGGAGNFGISNMIEGSVGEEDGVLPQNPIIERDEQIVALTAALEDSRKEVSDSNMLKENLNKLKTEMKTVKRESNIVRKKLEFARKVTEQRMAATLPSPSMDQEELVSLYSSLVDEDMFELGEEDKIAPCADFLSEVEEMLKETGCKEGQVRLKEVKNKILEKVRGKKVERRQRRDSISSVSSRSSQQGMKRSNSDNVGGDNSRKKTEQISAITNPSSIPVLTHK